MIPNEYITKHEFNRSYISMIRFRIKKMLLAIVLISLAAVVIQVGSGVILAAEHTVNQVDPQTSSGVAANGGLFSLDRCIEIALAKNPEIAASKWDIAAADSRYDAARSAFWPQISAEGGYQHFVDSQRLIQAKYNGEVGVFDNDLYRGDLIAKINLYAGGRMTSETGAAGKLSEAEKKKFVRTRDELIYSVAGVYFSILGQQQVIASLVFSLQALDENLKRTAQLYDARKVARVDVLRTEVRLTDLKQNLLREKNVLAVQRRILFSLMGYDAVPDDARFEDKLEFNVKTPSNPGGLIETALKNRPDFLAAKERVEAQILKVSAARAAYWPNLNVLGTYGKRNAPSPEDTGKNTNATESVGSVGLVLSVPIFDGGLISAKVREEMASLAAARERLKKLDIQIRQETETAFLDVLSNAERMKAMETAIDQAKESFRIESLKYEMGKGSLTDVLDAQAAQLLAETNYCRACVDYHTAMARLRLATGENI